jgi:T-complex protein 1 subunit theta
MLKSDTAFSGLLKEGYRHNEGIYEVTLNNIEACRGISEITKTSYGPQGMQKLIINHIDKLFVSNDASTILREINVNHPAANLVNMAAQV